MASLGEVSVDVLYPEGAADVGTSNTVINQQDSTPMMLWVGTKVQYDAIISKDSSVLYMVDE
jgi:hypothetical protein